MASDRPQLTWPSAQVPVEIFDEITTYLSRSDVKNLRLVNHEFDRMVSAKYFRNVVVPFRSEMYKARQKVSYKGDLEPTQPCTDTLFSSGMRIFQSFGEHILRFALSLELDEESLAYPPIKPTQKAITSYWGIYRWPHESYLRYTELEGLEQTADETASMKEALNCLTQVQELGLCCDAGLGYLLGPDQQLESPPLPHPVFGLRNLRYRLLHQRLARADSASMNARKLAFESPRDFKYTVLESMVKNAGYTQAQVKDAIAMLLSTENVSLVNIDFDERTTAAMATSDSSINIFNPASNPGVISNVNGAAGDDDDDAALQRAVVSVLSESTSGHPLQPRNLTRAQKEMLLELEWAHRALIQSYVIALIDNAHTNSFNALTTLTVAKIPSSHIFMFQRQDFWQSLPNLTNVALAVVADWRQVAKVAPGCVEDNFVSPVDAVAKAYQLLQDYVAKQSNIAFLHFEWICGGEFAPGITQRNLNVLPAPFCLPSQMVQPDVAKAPEHLLSLPYIKHLSLKNCYSTPHVFLQVVRSMALHSLEKLELESVSLTAPPTRDQGHVGTFLQVQVQAQVQGQVQAPIQAQQQVAHGTAHLQVPQPPPLPPAPLQPQAPAGPQPPAIHPIPHGMVFGTIPPAMIPQAPQQAAQLVQPPPLPSEPNWSNLRLKQPSLLTWAGIVERFTPAPTIKELMTRQDNEEDLWIENLVQTDEGYRCIPRPHGLLEEKGYFSIESMSFKSCGYVVLEVPAIDNHAILPINPPWQEPQDVTSRRRELAPFMQVCTDRLAAKITNYMPIQEQFNLTTAYGMDTEWTNVYDEEVIEAAKRDGIVHPGKGRFSGTISKTAA
nr:F-box domain-containing protein [Colletotrichum truncatum]KAF6791599.1 F-box domain-containing protein [Colletotrichum truncatum]